MRRVGRNDAPRRKRHDGLPGTAADSAERRERFEREAQTVAALNHPSIVTTYSVEEADGVFFLTMELVEG